MDETDWPLLLAVVTVVFGGFGAFCIVQVVQMRRLQRNGRCVTGTIAKVTRVMSGSQRHTDPTWITTAEYAVDGKQYQLDLPLSGSRFYREGEEVPVYFEAGKPDLGVVICKREFFKWIVFAVVCLAVIVGLSCVAFLNFTGRQL